MFLSAGICGSVMPKFAHMLHDAHWQRSAMTLDRHHPEAIQLGPQAATNLSRAGRHEHLPKPLRTRLDNLNLS